MLVNAERIAGDHFGNCELAVADEKLPVADHAPPDAGACALGK
jgi:hypothetical protein